MSGLSPVFKVSIHDDASGRWLENSIRFSVNEADASRAGREAVLAQLSEVLFVAGNPTRSKARSATSNAGLAAGLREKPWQSDGSGSVSDYGVTRRNGAKTYCRAGT